MRILIVEDEVPVARQIAVALTEDGHDPTAVHSGEAALDEMSKGSFDLIVLDVRLPGIDGFELLRRLRTQHLASRVLLLTARSAVDDRVSGLQLGADDYLPKPFAMRELIARVRALGRRYPEEPLLSLRVADLTLDLSTHDVHRGVQRIELSPPAACSRGRSCANAFGNTPTNTIPSWLRCSLVGSEGNLANLS